MRFGSPVAIGVVDSTTLVATLNELVELFVLAARRFTRLVYSDIGATYFTSLSIHLSPFGNRLLSLLVKEKGFRFSGFNCVIFIAVELCILLIPQDCLKTYIPCRIDSRMGSVPFMGFYPTSSGIIF